MPSLSDEDRKAILEFALQGVREAVFRGRPLSNYPTHGIFSEPRGLFVTLRCAKKLRGCIGIIEGHAILGENLVRCAADAALHDPRFSRLRPEELEDLDIEVSLLSSIHPIRAEDVEIGRHGLLVERGAQRGLLLPQVATEHLLGREQFLAETCVKAGLPREAWKEIDTRLYGFECEIISEEKPTSNKKARTEI